MGINFYWIEVEDSKVKEDRHIGKRSFAGSYCWECGVSYNKGGTMSVHTGNDEWWERCPCCEKWNGGSVACSFTWKKFSDYQKIVDMSKCDDEDDDIVIEDEEGKMYTASSFLELVLSKCPFTLFRQLYATFE